MNALPTKVLHDPCGIIADLLEYSKNLKFVVTEEDVDHSISKGLAAAHEAYRRILRGELLYANALLDEMRQHIMKADDWLNNRIPCDAVHAKFDLRGSPQALQALFESLCR